MSIHRTNLGEHNICFCFSPQEKQNLLFSNLKAGLDKGCSAVYIASGDNIEQVQVEMRKIGLETGNPKKLRILTTKQLYTPDGEFNQSLKSILGDGAATIETQILRKLREKMKLQNGYQIA